MQTYFLHHIIDIGTNKKSGVPAQGMTSIRDGGSLRGRIAIRPLERQRELVSTQTGLNSDLVIASECNERGDPVFVSRLLHPTGWQ